MSYGNWSPGIGDPTIAGWVTVVLYFAAALLCWRARDAVGPPERRWWTVVAVLLVLLGFNKQLDIQTLFTEIGRSVARAQGWYNEERRVVQFDFIVAMAIGGGVIATIMAATVGRRVGRWARLSMMALCALGVFVLIRATSFHHVDEMLGVHVGGFRYNTLLETTPLALIMLAAWRTRGRVR